MIITAQQYNNGCAEFHNIEQWLLMYRVVSTEEMKRNGSNNVQRYIEKHGLYMKLKAVHTKQYYYAHVAHSNQTHTHAHTHPHIHKPQNVNARI